jgi:hypothetical protein
VPKVRFWQHRAVGAWCLIRTRDTAIERVAWVFGIAPEDLSLDYSQQGT